MNTPPPTPDASARHPLEDDLPRLERIATVMWHEIHKVLHRTAPRRQKNPGSVGRVYGQSANERILKAAALGPTDILDAAMADLLATAPSDVTDSWEALAVGISQNKAKGALRSNEAWLSATEHRPKLTLISGDQPGSVDSDGLASPPVFDTLHADAGSLEDQFIATAQQGELVRLTHEILDDRDRAIFTGLHFAGRTRQSLAEEFGLTVPGVVHIYRTTARRLYDHPRFQRYATGGNQ